MKIKTLIAAGLLVSALTLTPAAAVSMTIDGTPFSAVSSFVEGGTTYVPLRAVAQQLGDVTVNWQNGAARVTSQALSLTAVPGNQWLEANGRCFYVEGGIRVRSGSVMVPVRVLAAAMGGRVQWDSKTGTVRITSGSGVPESAGYNRQDLYWLSRIISAESKGESLEGKLAVGTVILNRVSNAQFPNTIYDVIFDDTWGVQFTPASNGTIYEEPTAESVAAAKLVLEGVRKAGASLYFLNPDAATNHWAVANRTYVTTIGSHDFYE